MCIMESLVGKHIVLGITGSIAAYKAAYLVRALIKKGAEVQVVMTPSAKEFIAPLTLSTLTQKPVVSEFFDRRDGSWHSHVALGQWADLMLIAPASASTIAKMANGIADNMLLTTYLSMKAPTFVAPAMDLDMYRHEATTDNLNTLKSRGITIIEPGNGFLASGLEGKGRMEEPEAIVKHIEAFFTKSQQLGNKKVLITAGPTYEAIDTVRFIGNHSSGKMGIALAEAFREAGAEVTLVLGPSALPDPESVHCIRVTTALEMLAASERPFKECDIAIFSAAVADFRPKKAFQGKIKREMQQDPLIIELEPNPDIAATLSAQKRSDQLTGGFALETEVNVLEAQRNLQSKQVDFIVLNSLSEAGSGFGVDTNRIRIIDKEIEDPIVYPLADKKEVARRIVDFVVGKQAHAY